MPHSFSIVMCPAQAKSKSTLDKVVTGIEGLDKILNGGVPKGNTVLVTGACGTGKTTLSVEFLINGAKQGKKGVFISVTESREKLLENLTTYDFFDMGAVDKGDIQFIEFNDVLEKCGITGSEIKNENIPELIKTIVDFVTDNGASRLVVDSLTGILFHLKDQDSVRKFMFDLSKLLGGSRITSLLISEISPESNSYSTHGVEDAIADGIIMLGNIHQRGYLLRTLHVVKMRGTVHSRAKYVMDLSSYGIIIVPLLKSQS